MNKFVRVLSVFFASVFAFTLASCGGEEEQGPKLEAKDFVNLINLPQDGGKVSSDFTVPSAVTNEGITVDVTWTSDNEAALKFVKGEKNYTAKVTQSEEKEQVVHFAAHVDYEGTTDKKDFRLKVTKALSDADKLQYMYDGTFKKGDVVDLKGYLAWKGAYDTQYKNFPVYVIDATQQGGFYGFRTKGTQEEYDAINVKDAVILSGEIDVYNGSAQIKGGKLTKRTGVDPLAELTPVDINAALKEASIAQDPTKLNKYSNAYVTVDGLNIIGHNDINGDTTAVLVAERGGIQVSVTVNKYILDLEGDTAKAIVEKAKTLQNGKYVKATGFLTWYHGLPQINVLTADDFAEGATPELEDVEKIYTSLNQAKEQFAKTFLIPNTITLKDKGAKWNQVQLSYALKETSEFFVLDGNKLTIKECTEEKAATIVITATLGEVSKTLEVTAKALAKPLNAWEKYHYAAKNDALEDITGVVTVANIGKFNETDTYTECYAIVQNEFGGYYVRITGKGIKDDFLAKFVAGYTVTISGAKKSDFNGLDQVASVKLENVTKGEAGKLPKAQDITNLLGNNAELAFIQSSLVTVSGVLTSEGTGDKVDWFIGEGNSKLKVRNDSKLGTVPANTVYESLKGKKVTVSGVLGWFKAPQVNPLGENAIVEYVAPEYDVDLSFAGLVTEGLKFTDGDNIAASLGFDAAAWTITTLEGQGVLVDGKPKYTNPIALYKESLRIYHAGGDASRHGSVTFKNNAAKITKIEFTYNNNKKTGVVVNVNGTEYTCAEVEGVLTISFDTPVDEVTAMAINNQFRITNIKIATAK